MSGNRPDLGTFMLPFGFLIALIKVPFILGRGRGVGGPWILVISFIRVFRLGDWAGENFVSIRRCFNLSVITLGGGNFFGLQGLASDTGE